MKKISNTQGIIAIAMMIAGGPVASQQLDESTQHELGSCTIGVMGTEWSYHLNLSALDALAQHWCVEAAKVNTNANYQYIIDQCGPVRDDGSLDGSARSVRISDGLTVQTFPGPWGWDGCSCNTTTSVGAIIQKNQCYCPVGTLWSEKHQACVVGKQVDDTKNPLSCEKDVKAGDPIFPLTGLLKENALFPYTIGGIALSATYDSNRAPAIQSGMDLPHIYESPGLGLMWLETLHRRLGIEDAAVYPLSMGNGEISSFQANSDGTFSARPGSVDTLIKRTSDYLRRDISGSAFNIFDLNGLLTNIIGLDGRSIYLSYSDVNTPAAIAPGPGYLILATDTFGRSIQYSYVLQQYANAQTQGVIGAISDGVIQTTFEYGATIYVNGLQRINWPDGTSESFLYENSQAPTQLTGIVDESGVRTATFGWDTQGHAISTERAGGVNRYSVAYGNPPTLSESEIFDALQNTLSIQYFWVPGTDTVLIAPNGQTSNLGSVGIYGMPGFSGASQPAGSGCAASNNAQTYDSHGNVTNKDDFNGNRICYEVEVTRNLRTSLLEGLPTSKACPAVLSSYSPSPFDIAHPERKTTTVWHPDWALKTRESEPKKITTWVYNGQPDPIGGGTATCAPGTALLPDGKPIAVLCSRYEQATTDTTGALGLAAPVSGATRKWSYTYNQYGQVLTEATPKQSATDALSHTTTYVYYPTTSFSGASGYTMGDLQTVTNPLGKVTTYTSYDKAGRLLSSTDANNTVTTQTYFPRGWLQTQTVTPAAGTALTTTYAYYPTGLLQAVTMPDASTLNYTYDAAHRLTDVVDGAGNKVHYVLDNMGNRTSEQVSDASGHVVSTVARIYDALSRVQATTGAVH